MTKVLARYRLFHSYFLPSNNLQTCRLKTTSVLPPESKEEADILSYVDISSEFRTGTTCAVRKLHELFGLQKNSAMEIINKNKFMTQTAGRVMSDNYKLCRQYGIEDKTILSSLFLLGEKFLLEKLHLLQELEHDLNALAPLLELQTPILSSYVKNEQQELLQRIVFLSNVLQVPEFDICKCMVKRRFLFTLHPDRIKLVCQMLFDNGVSREEILKDMWVLRYSEQTINERIEYARSQNMDKIKTWMIRGSKDIFDKYIQRKSEYKSVLGNQSLIEYFSLRLNCTTEQAASLLDKLPKLKGRSLTKLQEIIDILYAAGFEPIDIVRSPKILFCHVETIKKRLRYMQTHRFENVGLHVFAKSQKQYMEYLDALKKKRRKNRQLWVDLSRVK